MATNSDEDAAGLRRRRAWGAAKKDMLDASGVDCLFGRSDGGGNTLKRNASCRERAMRRPTSQQRQCRYGGSRFRPRARTLRRENDRLCMQKQAAS
jgi:hypothetical protein